MTLLHAIILGIIEGLTEFLPVSSTGHLLLANSLMGLEGEAADSYVIVIQLGALLAVVAYYRDRLLRTTREALVPRSNGQRLVLNLGIAFLPAAVTGLLLEDKIDALMRWDGWIAVALIVGGIVMIVVERIYRKESRSIVSLDDIRPLDALAVGLAQCFALWPGMSRSMSTIVGGQLRGFTNPVAADFSFLLALPTLGAATLYKLVKYREALLAMEDGALLISVGLVVSFLVALAAITGFLKLLKRVGLEGFGVYRILLGTAILIFLSR